MSLSYQRIGGIGSGCGLRKYHTYPFHDTHYNRDFWESPVEESDGYSVHDRVLMAMKRSAIYAQGQYESVKNYVHAIAPGKPIHIGETGWSSISIGLYGNNGSFAADEYKQALYYQAMREWTDAEGISCFYFEAFDEQWKDANHPEGSENHFGLIALNGQAKYALWDLVDAGVFDGLTRGGFEITKSFEGDSVLLLQTVSALKEGIDDEKKYDSFWSNDFDVLSKCRRATLIEPKHDEYFKAICYHPVSISNSQRSWEFIDEDLDLMQEAGISVIRVYMPIQDKAILDKIAERE